MDKITEILSYWFGDDFSHGMPTPPRNALWFSSNSETDQDIKGKFEADLIKAATGEYDAWKESAEGRMALIILLDQFTRNIYRGTPQAFAYDDLATQLCMEGLALGHDKQLLPTHRTFFYLPLEHQESVEKQQLCVDLYEQLAETAAPEIENEIKNNLDYAIQHKVIIDQFGRFPHRNNILGRASTEEELAYLESTGTTFGQG